MEKIKCITFDKEAQENLPEHIKIKMKQDRENARKEMERIKNLHSLDAESTGRYPPGDESIPAVQITDDLSF